MEGRERLIQGRRVNRFVAGVEEGEEKEEEKTRRGGVIRVDG